MSVQHAFGCSQFVIVTHLRMLMMLQMVLWGLVVGNLYSRGVTLSRSPRGGTFQAAKRGTSHGKTTHLHSGTVSKSTNLICSDLKSSQNHNGDVVYCLSKAALLFENRLTYLISD